MDEIRPIAASPCRSAFSFNFNMKNDERITKGIDTNKGDLPNSSAIATVAKLT